jgi:ABC-2 type transport system permease protein
MKIAMKLIGVELFKLFKQRRTYYALGAIFLMEMVVFVIAYDQGTYILDAVLESLKDAFYLKGDLLNGNLLTFFLLNSLWFHLPLLLMIIVSGMFTLEYQEGTIRTVFLQPISKWKFLAAKYVAAMVFTVMVVFILAMSAFLLSYGFFGKGDLVVYIESLNFFESGDAFRRLLLAFLSGTLTMIFYSSLCMTLAVFLKESLKTWIVATLFLILTNLSSQLDFEIRGWDYWFFPKLINTWREFFNYNIPWGQIGYSHLMLIVFTVIVIFLGMAKFQKSDIG